MSDIWYLCTVCEFRLMAKIALRRAVRTEFRRKSRTPSTQMSYYIVVSPAAHNKPSSVCWEAYAVWSWTAPLSRPALPPSGWYANCFLSSLPPERQEWERKREREVCTKLIHVRKDKVLIKRDFEHVRCLCCEPLEPVCQTDSNN